MWSSGEYYLEVLLPLAISISILVLEVLVTLAISIIYNELANRKTTKETNESKVILVLARREVEVDTSRVSTKKKKNLSFTNLATTFHT